MSTTWHPGRLRPSGSIVPFVHEGLGNSSYLVDVGDGDAIVVDPDRSARRYIEAAEARGWRIVAALETHLHADFVTGAIEIADAGATIHSPADGGIEYPHQDVRSGDLIEIGDVEIEVRATPSHTPEHVSFVMRLADRAEPPLVFSGGALIIGGAARTDLIAPNLTDPLTRALYRDARRAFDDLADESQLLPTHGGGSFCSIGAGERRTSTLGDERVSNSVLTFAGDEDAFAAWFPSTFPGTPTYYTRLRAVNAAGPGLVRDIEPPRMLDASAFADATTSGGIVLDVRSPEAYAEGHIPGSLAIPFRDSFPVWLGWVTPQEADLNLVLGDAPLADVVAEARLVGYERIVGVLEGGLDAWADASLPVIATADLPPMAASLQLDSGALLVDVREPDEVTLGAAPGAVAIPLGLLERRIGELPMDRPVIATCGVGERAITALSILERSGFTSLANLAGGMDAWRSSDQPLVGSPGDRS